MIAVTITSLSLASLGLAFLAGLASFVSPCVLPLLPVYLTYIGGVGAGELGARRGRLAGLSLLFVAGFSCVFVLLGLGAGGIGSLLVDYRHELTIAAGVFVALSGLAVAAGSRLPQRVPGFGSRHGGPWHAFFTGTALAIAWTPCVGYALGGILALAGSSVSPWRGALLLLVYSAGLGLPFVLAATAFARVSARLAIFKRHYRAVQMVAGTLMILFGALLATGVFGRMAHGLPSFDPGGL